MIFVFRQVKKIGAIAVVIAALFAPVRVTADSFFYHFNNVFYGMSPTGVAPWLDALFTDTGAGKVTLTISAPGLVNSEYLSSLYFNLNPALNPANLTFTVLGTSGGFALPSISTGNNKFKADGDGKYDILLKFSAKTGKTFGEDESITYQIMSSVGTLKASDFDFLSKPAGGSGPFLSAAAIQGICDTPGWIAPCEITPVPEPTSAGLFALGLGLCVGARRWLRRSQKSVRV
jgi:PEP-CTERM motif